MLRVLRGLIVQTAVVAVALLSIGGCVVIDGDSSWAHQAKFERTVELQHPMSSGSTLTVSTASGSIDAAGQDTDQAQVVARIQARAATEQEAQELAEQVEIRFQEAGDRLEIKADKPSLRSRRSISISYDIIMPRQAGIECESASGSLKVRDLTGNVRARTASGSVEAARIVGAVHLHSASGSVHGDNLSGDDVELDTASGGVRLSDAAQVGTCRAHSSSGSVRVQRIQADSIRMDSGSGGVTGEDLNCYRLNARSGSGNVSVAFAPSAPGHVVADLGTGSGSIHVVLPPGFAGKVDLSVGSGSLRIDRPVTVRGNMGKRHLIGAIGDGTGSLTAHTGSGSIDVR
jgi:DUF4097 and DUF4098 domain-containing protein YvlB